MSKSDQNFKPLTGAHIRRSIFYTAIFNTAIAVLLLAVGFSPKFWQTFIFSQCVGLTICSFVMLVAFHFFRERGEVMRAVLTLTTIPVGAICGILLGEKAAGMQLGEWNLANQYIWRVAGVSMMLGFLVTPFFYNRKKLADTLALAQEEHIRRLSSEKLAAEADLKRLQAQIEPHFLFNTLSNILSLMDTEPAKAKSMQLDLIRYLRTSLGRTRDRETTLGQEIDLIRAYLDIYKIRMGPRLSYGIDVPAALLQSPLPPMLLQPLVENALIHGLEPKIEGGRITLTAVADNGILTLEIADTGNGICPNHRPGVGLTNVKKRLEQLFGPKGRLAIIENQPSGVIVRIEIPLSGSIIVSDSLPTFPN